MTNAKKYLKDTTDVGELWDKFIEYYYANKQRLPEVEDSLKEFMRAEATPTLTEDEKVILRNIQLYTGQTITIRRAGDSHLYISGGCGLIDFGQYNHLFQFIKERRRILNRRIIERRIEMTVLKLINKLKKYDKNAEVVIRFAIDEKDETGYILTPFDTGKYFDSVGIYCEDENTEEDYNFIGQMSLELLNNNTKRINDASNFVEYMCYDKEIKECVHDLKYSDCDKLLKILNGEEYSIEELLSGN